MTPNHSTRRALAAVAAASVAAGVMAPSLASSPAAAASGARPSAADVVPFTRAEATLTASGNERVEWKAPGVKRVAVYAAKKAGGHGRLVATRTGSGHAVIKAPKGAHPYVRLVPDHGAELTIAPRVISLDSAPNFRDLGGYRTTSGQWVRSGLVYRTAQLTLSAEDAATVDKLVISSDNDLRTTAEATAAPDTIPAGAVYRHLNVMGDAGSASVPNLSSGAAAQAMMAEGEKAFVTSDTAKAAYHRLFTRLAKGDGATLYHCTAGKDRTGWASAVLLTLLGVPKKTVMSDYLLSNTYYYNSPKVQAQLAAMPAAQAEVYKHFMDVEPAYLQTGLDQVEQDYGTMDAYARKGLGLSKKTVAKLKAKLLVGAAK